MTTEQYQIGYEDGHSDGFNEAVDSFTKPAQPDCRTCRFHHELGCHQYMSNMRDTARHCVNGDKYEAAPWMVLWRTK